MIPDNNDQKDPNAGLDFQSPQTEESRRLANRKTNDPVERKDEAKKDHGEQRGGNQSGNQFSQDE
jgi:hypothetical protein